ncbi:glycosyl hydrolase [Ilyonectria robusta]
MSASQHVGIMKYQFPDNEDRNVLVDISHYLPTRGKETQWYSNGELERSPDGTWYSGYGICREGWALGRWPDRNFRGCRHAKPCRRLKHDRHLATRAFMPEGRSHNHNGRVQGGSNSDNILADAYVTNLDQDSGYNAMRTNAELQPYNNFDFNDPTGSTKGEGVHEITGRNTVTSVQIFHHHLV